MNDAVNEFLDEVVDEAVGSSSKKWALLLVALIAGAAIALWLKKRSAQSAGDAGAAASSMASSPAEPVSALD